MHGPIITVDVSKSTCHFQPFKDKGESLRKPKTLKDDKNNLELILKVIGELKMKTKETVVYVVFKAAGIYYRCLQKYLDNHQLPYIITSPLLSINYRKPHLHGNKTDPLDCQNLTDVYYNQNDLKIYKHDSKDYDNLRKLNRYYETELNKLKHLKVRFRVLLDIIYPLLDKSFKVKVSIYSPTPLMIL